MVLEAFSHPEEWDLVNFRLKNELATQNQVRCYINPFLASFDLLVSLAQLYAHKRSIAWVTGASPLLENVQPHFVREGYQIQNIKLLDLIQAADQGQSVIDGLNKDTLFLVFFKDNALTGESFDHQKLEAWAAAKKIFFVLVSHQAESDFQLQPTSFGIKVYASDLTLVFLPERAKLNSSIGAYQNIQWKDQWSESIKKKNIDLQAAIQEWEDSLVQQKWHYKGLRSPQRSLLIFDAVHGQIVVEKLKEKGFSNATSYADCVSQSPKSIRSWIQPEISDQVLRGLISLSFKEARDIPSKELIENIVRDIQTDSEWTFK
ncbi:MAG: hypothetical protein JNL11_00775 [Bdellovibrionaceae bacterium]|nr:hypothetical protein [Pseudobdellovibrionaceae bacterium]